MLLTQLVALIAAATIQIHHCQVPVIQDKDVPVATVTVPEGAEPVFKVSLSADCAARPSAPGKSGTASCMSIWTRPA